MSSRPLSREITSMNDPRTAIQRKVDRFHALLATTSQAEIEAIRAEARDDNARMIRLRRQS